MSDETVQESHAKKIQEYLRKDIRHNPLSIPRPFFVEISGTPSSGKTTAITKLDTFFRRMGFRVLCPQEGAQVVRHIERTTPLYNLTTGLYALNILIDLSQTHYYDFVIFDRCLFDAYCWMLYWEERKKLNKDELVLIQAFFLSRFWINTIDVAYFMVCDPEKAMEREQRITLTQRLGSYTNPETLKTLALRYKQGFEALRPKFPQLKFFDTTNKTEKGMVEEIAFHILDALEKK